MKLNYSHIFTLGTAISLFSGLTLAQSHQSTQANFPSAQQLKQYTPPKPITEDILKQRLGNQIALIKKGMTQHEKQEQKYLENFTRFQKHQMDSLTKMMAHSSKQRAHFLNNVELQQQEVIKSFISSQKAATINKQASN